MLGAFAGLSAVEPLIPYTRRASTSTRLKEATRAAVQAIQERTGGGEGGALGLSEAASGGGGLSLG